MQGVELSVRGALKGWVEKLPEPVAILAAKVPYSARFWPDYGKWQREARFVTSLRSEQVKFWQQSRLNEMLREANRVPFYSEWLAQQGYRSGQTVSLDQFDSWGVLTKQDLRNVEISDRSLRSKGSMAINTGGTSGSPLAFRVDRRAFAREWAHMHSVWFRFGYRPSHLKLTLRGKRLADGRSYRYNGVHHELVANASEPINRLLDDLFREERIASLRWVHGYPSLVAELAAALSRRSLKDQETMRRALNGVLLGSEYPAAHYRSAITSSLTTNIVSWYGHSEMALLAWESAAGIYEPLPTYGLCSFVPIAPGSSKCRLIVTSLHNNEHPFIRYDTGDVVEPMAGPGCLGNSSFRIAEGRIGEFVSDRVGSRHSLTALIFGRHHRSFDLIDHVQVEQVADGQARLIVVPKEAGCDVNRIRAGFDLADVDIDWSIELVPNPIRTAAGKVPLLVNRLADSSGIPSQ